MNFFELLYKVVTNLGPQLQDVFVQNGTLIYIVLFVIIFCETGLVVTPFLPGDSLLFLVGSICAAGKLVSFSDSFNLWTAMIVICAAAIVGDTSNYHIGKALGPRIFKKENVKFLNRKNLEKTHAFYVKHGGKTIILARFIPVIRTFAPFVAGMGTMNYNKFIAYNVFGAIFWVAVGSAAGFFLGSLIPEDKFELVLIAIVAVSCVPAVAAWYNEKRKEKKEKGKA